MSSNTLTRDQIIQTIRHLADRKGRDWVTRIEFTTESGVSLKQVLKYFDKWNDAVVAAGLKPLDFRGRPDFQKGYSAEELIKKIRDVSRLLNTDVLTQSEFCRHTGLSDRPIRRVFGSWDSAVEKAGLKRNPRHMLKIPDKDLFSEYFRVKHELGRFPSYPEFARRSTHSIGVYEHRFGNFTEFRKNAIQYGMETGLVNPEIAQPAAQQRSSKVTTTQNQYKQLEDRPVLGEKIDFRGLLHAPVNELGVVYLFGILAEDMGFEVESVQAGFPDCEAKRRLKNNRWQRVRIEFEYKSSNFIDHNHDVTKCDLIVCWEHDWNNCPLEVIPLKTCLHSLNK